MDEDQVIVVQETEYTGAGKHLTAQLTFARENGIELKRGNPENQVPGKSIIIPSDPSMISTKEIDLDDLRMSYLRNCLKNNNITVADLSTEELEFLAREIKKDVRYLNHIIATLNL